MRCALEPRVCELLVRFGQANHSLLRQLQYGAIHLLACVVGPLVQMKVGCAKLLQVLTRVAELFPLLRVGKKLAFSLLST
jgi:hypothetical protein